jgi:hypothetical protein
MKEAVMSSIWELTRKKKSPREVSEKAIRRKYFAILFFFIPLFLVACGGGGGDGSSDGTSSVGNTNFEATESFSFVVDAGSHSLFGLTGENGEITITGSSSATSVIIIGAKRVQSESIEDAQAHLANLNVDLEERTSGVFVKTIQPEFTGGRNYIVDYTITLPENFAVLITNVNGPVTIGSIKNNFVSVVNVNGLITLNGIVGSASAAVVNGAIEGEVILPLNGKIDFNTVNGTINLAIPVSTSAEFSASTANGSINLSANLVLQNSGGTLPVSLSGTLGSGEGMIELEIANGDINVSGF